jgi:hypothetical protein
MEPAAGPSPAYTPCKPAIGLLPPTAASIPLVARDRISIAAVRTASPAVRCRAANARKTCGSIQARSYFPAPPRLILSRLLPTRPDASATPAWESSKDLVSGNSTSGSSKTPRFAKNSICDCSSSPPISAITPPRLIPTWTSASHSPSAASFPSAPNSRLKRMILASACAFLPSAHASSFAARSAATPATRTGLASSAHCR